MIDPQAISAALGSVQVASEIAKAIIGAKSKLESAELKLRLAEVVESLASAQLSIVQSTLLLAERDAEIAQLKESFAAKGRLAQYGDAFFLLDDLGNAIGGPLCSYCWEHKQIQVHLTSTPGDTRNRQCPNCKHMVTVRGIHWPPGMGPDISIGGSVRRV